MSKQNVRVEFEKLDDGIVELRHYDQPKVSSYLYWHIPIKEAIDLAKWWDKEGAQIRKRQLPLVGRKFRSILISMVTHARMDVRGFDQNGGLKLLGYSLPGKVVECLCVWFRDGQLRQKTKCGIKGKLCSAKYS